MQQDDPMVIFTRTFDFLSWLLPMTNNFPRAQRHTFTRRMLDAAFDLRERLEVANDWHVSSQPPSSGATPGQVCSCQPPRTGF